MSGVIIEGYGYTTSVQRRASGVELPNDEMLFVEPDISSYGDSTLGANSANIQFHKGLGL
jgi:hypothetical protein